MVPWVGLQYLIVEHVFPGHTHFLFILITAVMMVNSNKLHFVLKGGVKTQRGQLLNLGFGFWYYQLNWQTYHLFEHLEKPILFCIAKQSTLIQYFFTNNNTNYACWLPIHLGNMLTLE